MRVAKDRYKHKIYKVTTNKLEKTRCQQFLLEILTHPSQKHLLREKY